MQISTLAKLYIFIDRHADYGAPRTLTSQRRVKDAVQEIREGP
ncbi:hypothetical protein [Neochlamydia sp. S13]|nr:hypothetical protein [Neochlamydia sp. S13]